MTGADEYISDYADKGEKIYPHSNFAGVFGQNLSDIFPWASFFLGTQRDYLMKEELVAGTHGVEGRLLLDCDFVSICLILCHYLTCRIEKKPSYPFLDRQVVQEYLWLDNEVKNSKYKVVVQDMFDKYQYPFVGGKLGFTAHHNLAPEGGVRFERHFEKPVLVGEKVDSTGILES